MNVGDEMMRTMMDNDEDDHDNHHDDGCTRMILMTDDG